jgi:hypothetical protein
MAIFRRKSVRSGRGKAAAAIPEQVDLSLAGPEWFAASERIYNQTWRNHVGSPETFAEAGGDHYNHRNFAIAMLFYRKAIDLLHTVYTFSDMSTRQPSARDRAITSGFVSSLGATLGAHPAAPVAESVREATHRLRTISSACKQAGTSADLYLNALREIAVVSPHVMVDDILW